LTTKPLTSLRVLGVDARRGGWACALVEIVGAKTPSRTPVRWLSLPSMAEVLAVPADAVGVDIPIGLPARGRRACDLAAKSRLGAAHARVFLTPPRPVLDAPDHARASALHRNLVDGKGLSIQTWHVLGKVAETDAALAARRAALAGWLPSLRAGDVPPGDDQPRRVGIRAVAEVSFYGSELGATPLG